MTAHRNKTMWMKVVGGMLAAFVCAKAAAQTADSVTIGSSAGRSVSYEPVSGTDTAGVALYFPDYYMQAYKGCCITQLKLQLYNTVGEDSLRLFITHDLSGAPDYEQKVSAAKKSLTVELETPYEIGGEAIYVGYTVVGANYLCYSNSIANGEEWIWNKAAGWARYAKSYTATLTATVRGDQLPEDVRITSCCLPEHSLTNAAIPMSCQIVNLGASTVNSLGIDYTVDGNVVATETVSGLSVAPRAKGEFSLSALRMKQEGEPQVGFTIRTVNDRPDAVMADNSSRSQTILCRDGFTKRKTLLEVFSTEKCPNCPSAHQAIETVFGEATDVVEVGHHSGFYTDGYTIPASISYEWFYPAGTLYAPAIMFNRTCLGDNYSDIYKGGTPIVSPSLNTMAKLYEEYKDAPAYVSINLSRSYDRQTRQLDVNVCGERLLPLATPDSLRLYVMLTEDSLFSTTQRGASGGFYHRHALRQTLSGVWGDPVDVLDGYATEYHTTLPEEWNADHVSVVAFVANNNSTDKNDCRVLNVDELPLTDNSTGIAAPTFSSRVIISGGTLRLSTDSRFSLYDMDGRCVASGVRDLDVRTLHRGVYVMKSTEGIAKVSL